MEEKFPKKQANAWAFYDWANSVFPLVISTAIFPAYYESITKAADGSQTVNFMGFSLVNTELVAYINSFAFLMIALMSPMLSGIADYAGRKLSFLRFFCFLGGLACIGLSFFDPAHLEIGMFIYFLGVIGFWSSLVFYNSYLPEVAAKEDQDALSAKGFSLGYIGSATLLIILLILIMAADMPPTYAFTITGVWWIGFSFYTYANLPKAKIKRKIDKNIIFNGYKELGKVWKEIKQTVRLKRYLYAFFVFSMGIQTIMIMAPYFGSKEIIWPSEEASATGIIIAVLLIQFIAIPGAYFCSWLSKKMGNRTALIYIICAWAIFCIVGQFIYTPIGFYVLAGFVGFLMGGVQSLSRSTYSKFLPETKDTASYFSFYDVSEKIGIAFGTLSYGFLEAATGSMRTSILALMIFFIIGALLMFLVPKDETKIERYTLYKDVK